MGRDLVAFDPATHPTARRMHFLRTRGVTVVLDVGANAGQFAKALRSEGFAKKILSFEPQSAAFRELEAASSHDPLWGAYNYAVGSSNGTAEINIAANSYSSSLREMLPTHLRSAPESAYTGREQVVLRSVDSLTSELGLKYEVLYLKSDTQGYEADVLLGAEQSMKSIAGVEMELSLSPLYQGETLLADMIGTMSGKGYALMSIAPAFADPKTGQLLQVDAMFARQDGMTGV